MRTIKEDLGTCTAPDKPCTDPAVWQRRNGFRTVHKKPLCNGCWVRIWRANTKQCSSPGCGRRIYPRGQEGRTVPTPWCRLHEHEALEPYKEQLIEALLQRIDPDWDTGCWNWTGSVVNGYGRYFGNVDTVGTWVAHRLSWHLLFVGHEKHEELDHRCVNPLCVSPLHLQAVPKGENRTLMHERRKNPDFPWYGEEDHAPRAAEEKGWIFAMLKGLPWRNPVYNYSEPWEAHYRPTEPAPIEQDPITTKAVEIITRVLGATHLETVSLQRA